MALKTLKKLEAHLEERKETIMNEYAKMETPLVKLNGWEEVKNEILKKLFFSKLKVQNLRQFIPEKIKTEEQKLEETNNFLRKHLPQIYGE